MHDIGRRHFIQTGALAALSLGGGLRADDAALYAPFKMGLQTYSLRGVNSPDFNPFKKLDAALAKVKELGLTVAELWNVHMPPTTAPQQLAVYKEKLAAAGVTALAYGVYTFGERPQDNRTVFEFAQAMGIGCISGFFKPRAALSLDKLCDEFPNVRVGIHNHGTPDTYPSPEAVLDCVKDRHKNIGATADLGHFIRSKQDPLVCLEKLKDRLYGVHFKDFKFVSTPQGERDVETIVGDGTLKVKETLALLKKIGFQGCLSLEYELDGPKLMDDLKTALGRVAAACKEI